MGMGDDFDLSPRTAEASGRVLSLMLSHPRLSARNHLISQHRFGNGTS